MTFALRGLLDTQQFGADRRIVMIRFSKSMSDQRTATSALAIRTLVRARRRLCPTRRAAAAKVSVSMAGLPRHPEHPQ
jgi:hypothetical protein